MREIIISIGLGLIIGLLFVGLSIMREIKKDVKELSVRIENNNK